MWNISQTFIVFSVFVWSLEKWMWLLLRLLLSWLVFLLEEKHIWPRNWRAISTGLELTPEVFVPKRRFDYILLIACLLIMFCYWPALFPWSLNVDCLDFLPLGCHTTDVEMTTESKRVFTRVASDIISSPGRNPAIFSYPDMRPDLTIFWYICFTV